MKNAPLKLCELLSFQRSSKDFPSGTNKTYKKYPFLQFPIFCDKNMESRQFGAYEQIAEKYRLKVTR